MCWLFFKYLSLIKFLTKERIKNPQKRVPGALFLLKKEKVLHPKKKTTLPSAMAKQKV